MSESTEAWAKPDDPPEDRKVKEKAVALMNHAVVHYRKEIEGIWYCYEMHLEADELGAGISDYIFAQQYAQLLFDRFPTSGNVERYETAPDPFARGERALIKSEIDVVNYKSILEY
jgi:hypothetical protein